MIMIIMIMIMVMITPGCHRTVACYAAQVVLLLRLSPLLPLAASNYLYGLTSVALLPYVLGSWLGMLPGTLAYVSAGVGLT